MMHWRGLKVLILLAVCSAGGIVGMLVVDGLLETLFLLLTALPLLLGSWRAYALRDTDARPGGRIREQGYE